MIPLNGLGNMKDKLWKIAYGATYFEVGVGEVLVYAETPDESMWLVENYISLQLRDMVEYDYDNEWDKDEPYSFTIYEVVEYDPNQHGPIRFYDIANKPRK